MGTMYYNYGKVVSKEEFDKERKRIIAQRIKEAKAQRVQQQPER